MEISSSVKHNAEDLNLDDEESSDLTENRDGTDEATTSKDTSISPELDQYDHISLKAIDVNSADPIRQAIKAVLSGKTEQKYNEDTEPATNQPNAEVKDNNTQEFQPESGDQLHSTKQEKTRKRRGRPQKAGPSKRMKKSRGHNFFVGKLSNVVRRNIGDLNSRSESDSDASLYAKFSSDPKERYRFQLRYSK